MNRTFTVIEIIAAPNKANGLDSIVQHELPSNMVRVFVGREVSPELALAALDQAKAKLASGERISVTPNMAGGIKH